MSEILDDLTSTLLLLEKSTPDANTEPPIVEFRFRSLSGRIDHFQIPVIAVMGMFMVAR